MPSSKHAYLFCCVNFRVLVEHMEEYKSELRRVTWQSILRKCQASLNVEVINIELKISVKVWMHAYRIVVCIIYVF